MKLLEIKRIVFLYIGMLSLCTIQLQAASAESSAAAVTSDQVAPVVKATFSLTDYSQRLLRVKPEFCLLDLTKPGRCEGIKNIKNGLMEASDDERRVVNGLLEKVFSVSGHLRMLQLCTTRAINTCSDPSMWVNDGRVGIREHNFEGNVVIQPVAATKPFVEKVFVTPGEKLICMGDLHGSLHSFLRNLWHMVECGQLKDDFSLAPNHRLIFLGDLVDRGVYGSELILLLLCLLWQNPGRVHIARGNHEDIDLAEDFAFNDFGFKDEITLKYADAADQEAFLKAYKAFFLTLPHALFIGVGDEKSRWWMQCAHGGFDPFVDVRAFLGLDQPLAANRSKQFAWVESIQKDASHIRPPTWLLGEGLNWTDVTGLPTESSFDTDRACWNKNLKRSGGMPPGAGVCASIQQINDYLEGNGLKTLVRGHQDAWSCVKVLMPGLHEPQPWRVHPSFADYTPERIFIEGFYPSRLFPCDAAQTTPCFTCTTAGEGKQTLNEGYLIIRCAGRYEDTVFQVYENHLSQAILKPTIQETLRIDAATLVPGNLKQNRAGKFITIAPRAGRYADPYAAGVDAAAATATAMHRWVHEPNENPIHPALIATAKQPFVPVEPAASAAAGGASAAVLSGSKRNHGRAVLGVGGSASSSATDE